jgi:hypothetical protein
LRRLEADEFRRLLLDSVDDSIRGVLGEQPLQALYYSLGKNDRISRDDIPERLEDFENALTRLLGAGAPVITRMIARNLYARLEIPYRKEEGHDLRRDVEICRQVSMRRKEHVEESIV